METTPKPIRHRDGHVTIDGRFIGTVTRRIEPIGPRRSNGTSRWIAVWDVHTPSGEYVTKQYRMSLAIDSIVTYDRYSR